MLVLLTLAACASVDPPAADAGPEPPLVGTEWQLASYRDDGGEPVEVSADSTLRFSAKGEYSVHACNYFGGKARVEGGAVTFEPGISTAMACMGEPGRIEKAVSGALSGRRAWSIGGRLLTITGGPTTLTYRVRPSIYPDLKARTIVAGDRGGTHYRLAVGGPDEGRFWLTFESRTAPGEPWGSSGIISPAPGDCLASHVMPAGGTGGETYVVAWATPEVAKVTARVREGAPERALTFHAVPGSTLRVAGLWVQGFRPSKSAVTFYDRAGKVITAYPDGPC